MYWQNASDILVFGFVPLVWLTGLIVGRFRLVLVVKTAVFALAYLHVGVYFICVLLQKSSESLFSFYGALLLFIAPLVWLIAVILNIAEFVTIYHLRKKSPDNPEKSDDMLCASILHILCLTAVCLAYKNLYCLYMVCAASC